MRRASGGDPQQLPRTELSPNGFKTALTKFLKIVNNFCSGFDSKITKASFSKLIHLCVGSDDNEYLYYCEYLFGILGYFVQMGRLLLTGKLKYSHDQKCFKESVHPTKQGSYETPFRGNLIEINMQLTKICYDFLDGNTSVVVVSMFLVGLCLLSP